MGKETTGNIGQVNGTETERTTGTASGNSNSETNRETTGSGRTTGTATTGTATTGTETQEEKPLGIPILKAQTEEQKRLERNAKRRERYAQQKAENGGTVKPRKVNQTKKPQENKVDSTSVQMLIGTVSGMVASRPNMAHWQLTPTEIKSIADPLCNIMSESEMFNKVSEHTDAIALVTACFTVFVPRIVLTVSAMPKKEKKPNGNIKPIRTDRPEPKQTGKDNESSKRTNKEPTTNGTDVNNPEPWFGTALA